MESICSYAQSSLQFPREHLFPCYFGLFPPSVHLFTSVLLLLSSFSPFPFNTRPLEWLVSSHSVVSNSLPLHRLQHARLPCPSLSPESRSDSCPSNEYSELISFRIPLGSFRFNILESSPASQLESINSLASVNS